MRVVSVKGKNVGRSATRVPSGPVKVLVAFNWPNIGKTNIPLSFDAQEGQSYFVKYNRYPDPDTDLGDPDALIPLGNGLLDTGKTVFNSTGGDMGSAILAAPFVAAATAAGFANHAYQGASLVSTPGQAVNYIDLLVISSSTSGAFVSRVVGQARAYPPGNTSQQ